MIKDSRGFASKSLEDWGHGKDLERIQLDGFLERVGLEDAVVHDGERPDFLVEIGCTPPFKVGIELTRYYAVRPGPRGSATKRELEAWRAFVVELRERMLGAQGDRYFYGSLAFKRPPAGNLLQAVSPKACLHAELLDYTRDLPNERVSCSSFDRSRFPTLNEHVASLYTMPVAGKAPLWWASHLQAGPVPEPKDTIRGIVLEKAAKAASYDWLGADERWLLVVADAKMLDDVAMVSPGLLEGVSVFNFDRVILWNCFLEEVGFIWPSCAPAYNADTRTIHTRGFSAPIAEYLRSRYRQALASRSRHSES